MTNHLPLAGGFLSYGPEHLAILAATAAAALALACWARRTRTESVRTADRVLAIALLLPALVGQIVSMLPAYWNIQQSLPLHICDFAWMLAGYALWTRSFAAFSVVYYWGLVLVPQGLLTPPILDPLPDVITICHFASHSLTFIAAVYLTWGVCMRPNWRSFWIAFAFTVSMFIFMLEFNHLAGTNYMYVSGKLDTPSVLDALGPWPLYVVVEVIVLLFLGLAMTFPWTSRAARQRASAELAPSASPSSSDGQPVAAQTAVAEPV